MADFELPDWADPSLLVPSQETIDAIEAVERISHTMLGPEDPPEPVTDWNDPRFSIKFMVATFGRTYYALQNVSDQADPDLNDALMLHLCGCAQVLRDLGFREYEPFLLLARNLGLMRNKIVDARIEYDKAIEEAKGANKQ